MGDLMAAMRAWKTAAGLVGWSAVLRAALKAKKSNKDLKLSILILTIEANME